MWWDNAVIYQVYVRSFQDTDGDGIGDLAGVTRRLEHIARLGADAVWLSPIYPSPNADFGYDVTDFKAVAPTFGTLEDLDELVLRAHSLDLKVLLDFVPCHTSIEHPWFRLHPEYYVWSDGPANNWKAAFGGSSWGLDPLSGRYFLHSFFPEQADLNWRNPDVRAQMTSALEFWVQRGVDGFRLDALDRLMKDAQLRDDPPAQAPPLLPFAPEDAALEHLHSRNAPDIGTALQAIRDAVGSVLLVGEVYLPASDMGPYLESLDVVFSFEALHAAGAAQTLRGSIADGLEIGHQGWVLSNHDFSRLATRAGAGNARVSAMLMLTLPGPAFMLEGDELGVIDGRIEGPEQDRHGRDAFRLPMRWDDSASSGFTTGSPWLHGAGEQAPSVADQERDPESTLSMLRRVIGLRQELEPIGELAASPPDTIVLKRGSHVVAVNLGDEPRQGPRGVQRLVLEARPGDGTDLSVIPAHGGWIATRDA